MKKFVITTESGCDVTKELIERYDIQIVPMYVTMGNNTFEDGSFDVSKVFDFYDETGGLPKTAGTTPQGNIDAFSAVFAKYPDANIIHVGYSEVTSVSFNAANIAAKEFDNVYLVDSKNVSIGAMAIVKATAQFIEENSNTTPEEVVDFVKDIRERTRMVFLPKTLEYLKAGGRVSNLAFYGASLLNIHPTIVLENGYLLSGKRYRGSFDLSLKRMINDLFKTYDIIPDSILIAGAPSVDADYKEKILSILKEHGVNTVDWVNAGAVIASHSGPGALGIVGIEKK